MHGGVAGGRWSADAVALRQRACSAVGAWGQVGFGGHGELGQAWEQVRCWAPLNHHPDLKCCLNCWSSKNDFAISSPPPTQARRRVAESDLHLTHAHALGRPADVESGSRGRASSNRQGAVAGCALVSPASFTRYFYDVAGWVAGESSGLGRYRG